MFILASSEGEFGIRQGVAALERSGSGADAIEAACQAVEDDIRARTVGYGGAPNMIGEMELDASIMRGDSLQVGAIGGLIGYRHPISVARKVMERLPHVFLVGAGAARFAKEVGAEERDMLAPESKTNWENWRKLKLSQQEQAQFPHGDLAKHLNFAPMKNLSLGTVTFLIKDQQGVLWGGVSTSGWAYKYPGRLGDSPVVGAGLYVDNRYGGASCTHSGEMTIRCSTARSVVLYMKRGASVEDACREAVADLRDLKGGYLGPVIIHAIDKGGHPYVCSIGLEEGGTAWWWKSGQDSAMIRSEIL